jgi:flagellar hook-associated protein 2
MSYIDGIASGLDTRSIIRQLMQIERLPQGRLTNTRTQTERIASTFAGLRADVARIGTAATALRSPTTWQGLTATSNNPDVAVTARSGQVTGTLELRAQQTAAAATIYSNEVVPSLDSVILTNAEPTYSFDGIAALGLTSMTVAPGASITDGAAISVTQSSAAAVVTAQAAATPVTISAANNELRFSLNGTDTTVTLASGTYDDAASLAAAVDDALASAGLAAQLRAGTSGGLLELRTVAEGSAHSLQILNSSARADLGFGMGGPSFGTDGIIEFNGVQTVVSDTTVGTPVELGGIPPMLAASLNGQVRSGQAFVRTIDLGSGSLMSVVNAINTATGLGYRAAAVNVGGGYRLQLTAKETGADSSVDIDTSQFTFSGFTTLTAGRDAVVQVEGDQPYTITSSSNTIRDLLPGVDVTLLRATTQTATITVSQDLEARADKVKVLVDEMNTVLKKLTDVSRADADPAQRGSLAGSSEVRRARQDLIRALSDEIDETIGAVANVGITLQRDGTIAFDRDRFLRVAADDPQRIEALFIGDPADLTDSVADRLVLSARNATSLTEGYLKVAEDGARNRIVDLTRQIDTLERRYVAREAYYRQIFSTLETSLGGLRNQSNWLANQLGSLG